MGMPLLFISYMLFGKIDRFILLQQTQQQQQCCGDPYRSFLFKEKKKNITTVQQPTCLLSDPNPKSPHWKSQTCYLEARIDEVDGPTCCWKPSRFG
mmetsp:Transcript_15552/g.38369  ORF Transcript_15552/g.38369 Transcript_15552/m.38369 type:complete len:96 (-) Transcript_15552:341-628(-)